MLAFDENLNREFKMFKGEVVGAKRRGKGEGAANEHVRGWRCVSTAACFYGSLSSLIFHARTIQRFPKAIRRKNDEISCPTSCNLRRRIRTRGGMKGKKKTSSSMEVGNFDDNLEAE